MHTLESIALQELPAAISIRVVIADNDTTDIARTAIREYAETLGLLIRYVHAPARNISIARNACLDAAKSDWIAFIDDDEVALPDWIASLLAHRGSNHIVFGVSQALYPDRSTPKWMVNGDFHSNRIAGNDKPWNGYTANVLIDRNFVMLKQLRFALELGQIGGEDTVFFFDAHRAGARFGYVPTAVVQESTSRARASFRWLALRRYRAGQIHYIIASRAGQGRRVAILAVVKIVISALWAIVTIPWPTRAFGNALRAMLHLGVVASSIGFAPYKEYRRPASMD